MLFCVSTVTGNDNEPVGLCALVEADSFTGAVEKAAAIGSVTLDSTEIAALRLPAREADPLLKHREEWEGKVLNAFEMLVTLKKLMAMEGVDVGDDADETN